MDDLLERLRAYGADVEGTLERFAGDADLYVRCLGMLRGDGHLEGLADAVARGDAQEAFAHAHALKGVTGNLGLTPLYEAVCAVTEATREGSLAGAEPLCGAVVREWERAGRALGWNV